MVIETVGPADLTAQPCQAELAIADCAFAPRNTCGPVNPDPELCDVPGFPSFEQLGYEAKVLRQSLKWPDLKAELDSCRPILFGWCLPGECGDTTDDSTGHWMVAAAADVCHRPGGKSVPIVRVFNPAPCCSGKALWLPFSVYESGGAAMDFWRSYSAVHANGNLPPAGFTSKCRVTSEPVDPEANFTIDGSGTPEELVKEVVRSCLHAQHWLDSKLLRPPFTTDLPQSGVVVDPPVRRRLISLRAFAGLQGSSVTAKWSALLGSDTATKLLVFPVRMGQKPLVNVVLEEDPSGRYTLQAIEDSEAAGSLRDQLKKASQDPPGSVTQVVFFEVGVSLLSRSTTVVEITSQTRCSLDEGDEKTRVVKLQNLPSILEPLAAPFLKR